MKLIGNRAAILFGTGNGHVKPASYMACVLPIFYSQDGKRFYSNDAESGRRVSMALWSIIEKEIADGANWQRDETVRKQDSDAMCQHSQ